MTKNIVLAGGPDDGRVIAVANDATTYTVVKPLKTDGFKILLTSTQQGIYQQTGEFSGMNEVFTWQGWKWKSMTVNELRVGNYILFKQNSEGKGKIGQMKRGDFGVFNDEEYHPIALTPEWMQQYHKKVEDGSSQFKEWAASTLNIDIDDQLKYDQGTSKADIAKLVLSAVANQIPFILHNGPNRFCVIIPKLQIIAIYGHYNQAEILTDKQFQNRIKMLYVIYPQFDYASLKLVQSALELAITNFKSDPPNQITG